MSASVPAVILDPLEMDEVEREWADWFAQSEFDFSKEMAELAELSLSLSPSPVSTANNSNIFSIANPIAGSPSSSIVPLSRPETAIVHRAPLADDHAPPRGFPPHSHDGTTHYAPALEELHLMQREGEHPTSPTPGGLLGSAPAFSPITNPGSPPAELAAQHAEPASSIAGNSVAHLRNLLSDVATTGGSSAPAYSGTRDRSFMGMQSFRDAEDGERQTQEIRQSISLDDDEVDNISGLPLPAVIMNPSYEPVAAVEESDTPDQIKAFAKLEFEDGQFYMNTYSIEIGRDVEAAKIAEHQMLAERDRKASSSSRKDGSNPDIEQASRSARLEAAMSAAQSVASGGIMHLENGAQPPRRRRKRRGRSKMSPQTQVGRAYTEFDYQGRADESLHKDQNPRRVDVSTMMPSPHECPLIPIHPSPTEESSRNGGKGISRRHVRIAYSANKGIFELECIGRNGCFIDDVYLAEGEVRELVSGTRIQIGGVGMTFILPNVPDGSTGRSAFRSDAMTQDLDLKSDAVSQSAMSFDFQDGMGEYAGDDRSSTPTTDNEDDRYRELRLQQQRERESMGADESDEDDEDDELDDDVYNAPQPARKRVPQMTPKQRKAAKAAQAKAAKEAKAAELARKKSKIKTIKLNLPRKKSSKAAEIDDTEDPEPAREPEPEPEPAKKRGPGRPPKNGIMSKREQAEIKRKEKEAAKAKRAEETPVKEDNVEDAAASISPAKKRKGSKTKAEDPVPKAEPEPDEVIQSIEMVQGEAPAEPLPAPEPKPPKEKIPKKPPRSPSPEWPHISTFTPQQLAKPNASYVVLIHEALSNSTRGPMSLPQIYRAIQVKYPHYKYKVDTPGWQSSVRHNLGQHAAFVKVQREGKGYLWGVDKNISIEREKKRRPTPPSEMQPQTYGVPPAGYTRGYAPNGYMTHVQNGQQHPPPNPYEWPNNPQAGRGYPPPNPMQRHPYPGAPPAAHPGTYQSPYDTSRINAQQGGQNQAQNQAPTQPPQMPPPYLNQNRPGQQGQVSQQPPNGPQTGQQPHPNQAPQAPLQNGQGARSSAPAGQVPIQRQPGPPFPPGQTPPTNGQLTSPPPPNPYDIPAVISTGVSRFIGQLRASLAGKMPDLEAVLSEVTNKALGIQPPRDRPFRNFPQEQSLMRALAPMLKTMGWPVDAKIAYAEGRGPPVSSVLARPPQRASPAGNGRPTTATGQLPQQQQQQPVRQQQQAQQPAQQQSHQLPQRSSDGQNPASAGAVPTAAQASQRPVNLAVTAPAASAPATNAPAQAPTTQTAQTAAASPQTPQSCGPAPVSVPQASGPARSGGSASQAAAPIQTQQPQVQGTATTAASTTTSAPSASPVGTTISALNATIPAGPLIAQPAAAQTTALQPNVAPTSSSTDVMELTSSEENVQTGRKRGRSTEDEDASRTNIAGTGPSTGTVGEDPAAKRMKTDAE